MKRKQRKEKIDSAPGANQACSANVTVSSRDVRSL
jgi:hypothetical protein